MGNWRLSKRCWYSSLIHSLLDMICMVFLFPYVATAPSCSRFFPPRLCATAGADKSSLFAQNLWRTGGAADKIVQVCSLSFDHFHLLTLFVRGQRVLLRRERQREFVTGGVVQITAAA